jgi:mannose-6-phosphate isomerase
MMISQVSLTGSKTEVFSSIEEYLKGLNFNVVSRDFNRPWGGFFVIDEAQAPAFAKHFFPEVKVDDLRIGGKLSPKILVTQPGKRLSWQYHHRRAEIWKLVAGDAGIATSQTDDQGPVKDLKIGEIVRLNQGQRHRLVGTGNWGMVSEIWQHTDANNPSDEDDIVRLQDDFGR